MPDESCRNCGGQLAKCTICAECRSAVSMVCVQCGVRTAEQVHALCFMPEMQKIEESSPLPSGIFKKQILVA
ncbi:MAG: hypothetical protein ACT4NT_07955 [Nitrososphaerota archaeon]